MKEMLKDLLEAYSPSSQESLAISVWNDYCSKIPDTIHSYSDKMGNSAWSWGNGKTKILLSAHLDEIALIVSSISEEGFVTMNQFAGVDKNVLIGSQIVLMSKKGPVKAIAHSLPIHLQHATKSDNKVTEIYEIKFDVGASSKKEVEDMGIFVGCLGVLDRNINLNFGNSGKFYGNALDDKIGVYTIFKVLSDIANDENYKSLKDEITLTILATTQEESGLRGAIRASRNINPDISIDIDVTHANDCKLFSGERFGNIKLGSGVVIEFGQDKSRYIANSLINLAEKNNVKYQTGVSRCGGTNTNAIELNTSDCETMLLSIPLLSMHTQNETMHWDDVNSTIDLIKLYLKLFSDCKYDSSC